MHVEGSGVLNRPVQEVFDYVANPANLPEWSGAAVGVRGIQHASPGKLGVGDEFTSVHQFLGRRLEEHVKVTAIEPNRRILHRSTGAPCHWRSAISSRRSRGERTSLWVWTLSQKASSSSSGLFSRWQLSGR